MGFEFLYFFPFVRPSSWWFANLCILTSLRSLVLRLSDSKDENMQSAACVHLPVTAAWPRPHGGITNCRWLPMTLQAVASWHLSYRGLVVGQGGAISQLPDSSGWRVRRWRQLAARRKGSLVNAKRLEPAPAGSRGDPFKTNAQ